MTFTIHVVAEKKIILTVGVSSHRNKAGGLRIAVAYPGFFLVAARPPPAHLFFRRQRDWAGPIWKPPFRPVVDTPLLVFCCLSYDIKTNMPFSKPSIPCVILTTSIWSPRIRLSPKLSIYTVILDLHN